MFTEFGVTPELVDLIPLKVAALDQNGVIRFANKTFADYLGLNAEQMVGKKPQELYQFIAGPADIVSDVGAWVSRTLSEHKVEEFELTISHPLLKEPRNLFCRTVPDQRYNFVIVFFRDITDNIRSRESEDKFRSVFESASDGMVVMNANGIITSFNNAAEQMFGYNRGEVVGQNAAILMPQSVQRVYHKFVERYMRTRTPKLVNTRKTIDGDCVRKDGSIFPAALGVASFVSHGDTFFTALVRDISARRAHEQATREWNEGLEAEVRRRGTALDRLYSLSDDILGTIGFEGCFTSISPSCERIAGVSPSEMLHRPFLEFVHPDDRLETAQVYAESMRGVARQSFEIRVINETTKEIHWTQWNVMPDLDEQAVYVVGRDITLERHREEVLRHSQKMEAIGQLTGGIAHDFNNLLMAISGCVDLIESKLPDNAKHEVAKYIDGAQTSVKRAATLTHRLLAFARRQPLAPVGVNVNKLIQSMEELITRTIGAGVEICLDLNEVPLITCDPNQLESALLNLIINARDALPDGSGKVIIKTDEMALRGARHVRIQVVDHGVGMNEAVRSRAFDPFFTTKGIGKGTGLGLSMLYGFVNQSEGTVELDSTVGHGTTVSVCLPASMDAIDVQMPEKLESIGSAPCKNILVVEDEPIIRELISDALSDLGHNTLCAGDGNEALKLLKEHRFDMVVTDVGLPGLNGKQVASAARELDPMLRILFVTGYAEGVTQRKELVVEGSDMLLKPFTIISLRNKVGQLLNE